jgi:hypothetical protein
MFKTVYISVEMLGFTLYNNDNRTLLYWRINVY